MKITYGITADITRYYNIYVTVDDTMSDDDILKTAQELIMDNPKILIGAECPDMTVEEADIVGLSFTGYEEPEEDDEYDDAREGYEYICM